MTIRTEISDEWRAVLETLPEEAQRLLIDEAEHLSNAMKYENNTVRISTNGALEILFVIGCEMNRRNGTRKGNR
jgi:hypothetical protein